MCLLDAQEPMRLIHVYQASTVEPLFTIFDVLYVCALINVYM